MHSPELPLTSALTSDPPVYFIADSHLGIEPPEVERAKANDLREFLAWLEGCASHLYLVGDTFDYWFEHPYRTRLRHAETLAALFSLAASGTRVHFLGGNHDYWAGGKLEAASGAFVHRTPVEATHFGRKLFIAHGDGLPRGDWGYRVLKTVLRNPLSIAAFGLVPPRAGEAIARWASGLSTVTEERIDLAMPPMLEFLRMKLLEGYDAVVVGHVHRQVVMEWDAGTGIIVGDWMAERSVVELGPDGFRALRWQGGALRPPA